MRGKASGSDKAAEADWAELSLEESGGFAGLRRGATLQRGQVSPASAKQVAAALGALADLPASKAVTYPDGQTLHIRVRSVSGAWSAAFDTADLPKAAADLLELAPLGPLPPP